MFRNKLSVQVSSTLKPSSDFPITPYTDHCSQPWGAVYLENKSLAGRQFPESGNSSACYRGLHYTA